MSDLSNRIVQKLWSYCNVLRDDGLSYQDYLEQLTFLLFLKMADERASITGERQIIPKGYRWSDLANPAIEGVRLEEHSGCGTKASRTRPIYPIPTSSPKRSPRT